MQSQQDKDLASLVRVRNRLANSPDESLPKILTGLLPRLLARLENIQNINLDLRTQMQTQLLGTLSHAVERVRGNATMETPWLSAILPNFVDAQRHLTRTTTATFIKVALSRIQKLGTTSSTMILTSTLSSLFQVLDYLQPGLINSPTEANRTEIRSISWLCLDVIAILYNMTPMIDTDLVDFDRLTYKEPDHVIVPAPYIVEVVHKDGRGTFDLFLDLFLYLCEDVQFAQRAISSEGRLRIWHRNNSEQQRQILNENAFSFLKQLQYNCFQYCVRPNGLFQGKDTSVNFKRRIMFCVLMATEHDRIGRLATDTLNRYIGRQHLVKHKNRFLSVQPAICDMSMAVSLLILVLGDISALPVLSNHLGEKSLWEDIIGQRPTDASLQRPPLPQAGRVLDFISEYFGGGTKEEKDLPKLQLFLDLVIATHKSTQQLNNGHTTIHLIDRLNTELEEGELLCNSFSTDFRKYFFDAATSVINLALDNTMTQNVRRNPERRMELLIQQNEERLNQNGRNRMDILLANHRQSMKRKRQNLDDAVYAREIAYKLIIKLAGQTVVFHQTDTTRFSFQLPIMLLYCFQMEVGASTIPFVSKALTSVLNVYKRKLHQHFDLKSDTTKLQNMATHFLPALLDTIVCYETPAARMSALEWISEFLILLDPVASHYLLKYLKNDDDYFVKTKASAAIISDDSSGIIATLSLKGDEVEPSFRLLNIENDIDVIRTELETKVRRITSTSTLALHEAVLVLFDNNFNVEETMCKLDVDTPTVFESSGIIAPGVSIAASPDKTDQCATCEICYSDDIAISNMHSLGCSHIFCQDCWKAYIGNLAAEGRNYLLNARCPSQTCGARVTFNEILAIDSTLVPIWDAFMMDLFIERCSSFTVCPGPDCSVAVWNVSGCTTGNVTCTDCNTNFCFTCQNEPHDPATCSEMKYWKRTMGSSDSWIKRNTKSCPGCDIPIQKNHGCNHMHCLQCGCHFCWVCLSVFDLREAHQCNQYTSNESPEKRVAFYAERFLAHEEAELFAKNYLDQIDDCIQNLVDTMAHFEDDFADIITFTSKMLLVARHFLKYSYVASFSSSPDTPYMTAFQDQQGALELFVEKLSQLAISNLKAVYIEKGEKAVYKHIHSMGFYASSVVQYMERIKNFVTNAAAIQDNQL